jgi:hypothetical protein
MSAAHSRPFPTADEIAARAHELFTTGGRRIAMIPEYWRVAERELRQRAVADLIPNDFAGTDRDCW